MASRSSKSTAFPAVEEVLPEIVPLADPAEMAAAQRLRDALATRRPQLVQEALDAGAPLHAQVKVQVSSLTEKTMGWLSWAVRLETRTAKGYERSSNITESLGLVKTLLKAGLFDEDALLQFPSRWQAHEAFHAIEWAGFDRMLTLPLDHWIFEEAREQREPRRIMPRWSIHDKTSNPTWLIRAVDDARLDVVEHWLSLGLPITTPSQDPHTAWVASWYRQFSFGAMGLLSSSAADVAMALEPAIIATPDLTTVGREVLGLLNLIGESFEKSNGFDHAPTRERAHDAVERVLLARPMPLVLTEEEAKRFRLAQNMRQALAEQERRLLIRENDFPTLPVAPRARARL